MPITLVPISAQRFPSWRKRSQDEYEADLIAIGETPRAAEEHAGDALERAFPAGTPTPDNIVFDLVDDTDDIVGYLWIGRDNSGDDTSWWVWDVVVEPEHRGQGYGRAAMQLAEDHARAAGAHTLGLSVFGFNATDSTSETAADVDYQVWRQPDSPDELLGIYTPRDGSSEDAQRLLSRDLNSNGIAVPPT